MTNTTPGRSIDPRFDPAFQPGYDPQSDPARAARVPTYDASVDSPRSQPGRVVEPPRSRYAPETVSKFEPPRITDAADPSPAAEELLVVAPMRRNPFVVTLWVLGVGFVVAGALLINFIKNFNDALVSSTNSGTDYIYLQVAVYCVPGAFILGFGTIIALLFLHARRWNTQL